MTRVSREVRRLYLRRRRLVAVVLVLLLIVSEVVDWAGVRATAALALLALILETLFEIDAKVRPSDSALWFQTFDMAIPEISEEVRRRCTRRAVRLRWLGVTQEAGWPVIQSLMLEVIDNHLGDRAGLRVEMAILDPTGSVCAGPYATSKNQIAATVERVAQFQVARADSMKAHNCTLSIVEYDFQPTWHGLLVDDDLLYFSTTLPQNRHLAAPQAGVEVVSTRQGNAAAARIEQFASWFPTS